MTKLGLLTVCACIWLMPPGRSAVAGEVSGSISGCDLSSSYGCKWKPKGCFKPSPPFSFVSDTRSYNSAVDAFNDYLGDVAQYKQCMVNEAQRDIRGGFPDVVVKGVREESSDVDREADSERSILQMKRPR